MGIVCHLANGSEGCVHRAGRYITVTRPTIFVVARVAQWLKRLALCARRMSAVDRKAGGSNPRSDYELKGEDFQPWWQRWDISD